MSGSTRTRGAPEARPDLHLLKRIDALFEEVLDLDGHERSLFLDRLAESESPEVVRHVRELLAASEDETALLEEAGALGRELLTELPWERPLPERIGDYRVLGEIDRGGMGLVLLAERADGVLDGRRVAIKTLRSDGGRGRERFRRERQILADLIHPNIARLLDGGWMDDGVPFLVVELVDGERIDRYCDRHDLGWRGRIGLLIQVCRAVEAAHRRLVVHRDIKPANVLVAENGEPKLLDFGISSLALDEELDSEVGGTGGLMTPQYASPEQYRGETAGAASDVYQLGLLAYEVLGGERPYQVTGTDLQSDSEVVTGTVPEPVTQLSRGAGALRGDQLPADLDPVLAKALAKAPGDRYGSVGELRRDLESVLERRPVTVVAPTPGYLMRRFVQRNRVAVAVASGLAVLIVGLVVGFSQRLAHERDRALESADRSREQTTLARAAREETEAALDLVARLFESSDPHVQSVDQGITAEGLVEAGRSWLASEFSERPRSRVRVVSVLGRLSAQLGDHETAAQLFGEALEGNEDLFRQGEPAVVALARSERLVYQSELAMAENALEQWESAIARLRAAIRECGPVHGTEDVVCAALMSRLANTLQQAGRPDEGLPWVERSLRIYRSLPDDQFSEGRIDALLTEAACLAGLGRYGESEPRLREVAEWYSRHFPDTARAANTLMQLAFSQQFLAKHDLALANAERSLEVTSKVLPRFSFERVDRTLGVIQVALDAGQYGRAEELLDELEGAPGSGLHGSREQAARSYRANLLLTTDRPEQALPLFERLLGEYRRDLPESHPRLGVLLVNYGEALLECGELPQAATRLREGLEIFERSVGADHLYASYPHLNLGRVALLEGERSEARRHLERALAIRLAVASGPTSGEGTEGVAEVRRWLAEIEATDARGDQ